MARAQPPSVGMQARPGVGLQGRGRRRRPAAPAGRALAGGARVRKRQRRHAAPQMNSSALDSSSAELSPQHVFKFGELVAALHRQHALKDVPRHRPVACGDAGRGIVSCRAARLAMEAAAETDSGRRSTPLSLSPSSMALPHASSAWSPSSNCSRPDSLCSCPGAPATSPLLPCTSPPSAGGCSPPPPPAAPAQCRMLPSCAQLGCCCTARCAAAARAGRAPPGAALQVARPDAEHAAAWAATRCRARSPLRSMPPGWPRRVCGLRVGLRWGGAPALPAATLCAGAGAL